MDPSGIGANCEVIRASGNAPFAHECDTGVSHYAVTDLEKRRHEKLHERNHHGWRRIILNFTPSWFSVTMGTGIASILLHNLPYNGVWIYWISVVIFCLNIVLFVTFLTMSILRYIMFRGLFTFMIRHPVQSLFLGTLPMGLATIINMIVFVCVPAWGQPAITLAWTLWWIDVIISVATCFWLPFVIMYVHETEFSKMTAAWLLPIVSTIVASASGGVVAEVLPNPQHALWTLITSYILWGTGFPLAMVVLVVYFHRLTMYHLPPREVIVSCLLPLGPIGQGSFSLMQLGKVALKTFPQTNTLATTNIPAIHVAEFFYLTGHYAAIIIWGYGLVWLFFAVASISRSKFPFNMGWWGFTFPLGVYTVATTTLAKDMPSLFFKVLGTILSIIVIFLWLGVSVMTLIKALKNEIFFAPCVKDYERERAEKEKVSV